MTSLVAPVTAYQNALLEPLIRPDAWKYFQASADEIYSFWSTLVLDTSLGDPAIAISDIQIKLRVLGNIISDSARPYWQHRLAYLRLARFLIMLPPIMAGHKRSGQLCGRPGHNNSTVLLETYTKALEGQISRAEAVRHVRFARRWSLIMGGSMFLGFAYSDKADSKMYVF